MTDLTSLTLAEARSGLAHKSFTSLELTDAHLEAIEAARALNAFVMETPDQARAMAREADAKIARGEGGPLAGIPLGIKDLFATRDVRTTACSKILANFVPPYESTVTSQLWRDGAVMLGKLNNDEFAMGSSNETSCFGPVVNPWRRAGANTTLVPGGSSGGSASAVAALLCLGGRADHTGGFDPPAGRVSRARRRQADLRPLLALGHRGVCLVARSGRTDRAHHARCRDPDALDGRARPQGHHLGQSRSSGLRGRDRQIRQGHEDRHSQGVSPRRHAGGNRKALERWRGLVEGGRRGARGGVAAAHQICAAGLLHRGAGGSLVQSRPL